MTFNVRFERWLNEQLVELKSDDTIATQSSHQTFEIDSMTSFYSEAEHLKRNMNENSVDVFNSNFPDQEEYAHGTFWNKNRNLYKFFWNENEEADEDTELGCERNFERILEKTCFEDEIKATLDEATSENKATLDEATSENKAPIDGATFGSDFGMCSRFGESLDFSELEFYSVASDVQQSVDGMLMDEDEFVEILDKIKHSEDETELFDSHKYRESIRKSPSTGSTNLNRESNHSADDELLKVRYVKCKPFDCFEANFIDDDFDPLPEVDQIRNDGNRDANILHSSSGIDPCTNQGILPMTIADMTLDSDSETMIEWEATRNIHFDSAGQGRFPDDQQPIITSESNDATVRQSDRLMTRSNKKRRTAILTVGIVALFSMLAAFAVIVYYLVTHLPLA